MNTIRYAVCLLFASATLAACGGSGNPLDVQPLDLDEVRVQWTRPDPGTTVSGTLILRCVVQVPTGIERQQVYVGSTLALTDESRRPLQEIRLVSGDYSNGPQVLALRVEAEGGEVHTADLPLVFANPSFSVVSAVTDRTRYESGDEVTLLVDLGEAGQSLTASFAELDSGYAEGAEYVADLGDGTYHVTYTLSGANTAPSGRYRIGLRAWDAEGRTIACRTAPVAYLAGPRLPLEVAGGVFDLGRMPSPSIEAGTPEITGLHAPSTIITRGVVDLEGTFYDDDGPDDVVAVQVEIEGFEGHYSLPLMPSASSLLASRTESGFRMALSLPSALAESLPSSGELPLRLTLLDRSGHVSNVATRSLNYIRVNPGPVQVSLKWDAAADVDLHVVEPSGEEVYWSNTRSWTGGELDLDSNAACDIDGVNNENIAWSDPPAGEYVVRVDLWDACSTTAIDYVVTVRASGTSSTYTGSFTAEDADHGGRGSGVEVARFVVQGRARVHGTIRYEYAPIVDPNSYPPVSRARIEVRDDQSGNLMATGDTKEDGSYDIEFATDGTPGYRVAVVARSASTAVYDVCVENHNQWTHTYVHPQTIDDSLQPNFQLDIDIREVDESGAFHILHVMREGLEYVLRSVPRNARRSLPALEVRWARASPTPHGGSYFLRPNEIAVSGSTGDPDEFDDSVLLHEFFHLCIFNLSVDDTTFGSHHGQPVDPRLAWSEGAATAFGALVAGSRYYVDRFVQQGRRVATGFDIEAMALPDAYGTHSGRPPAAPMTWLVSELLVAAVVWDLMDGGVEPHDTVRQPTSVLNAIFTYLPRQGRIDRGHTGVDLVDFLDGARCYGIPRAGLEAILQERVFPYDFGGPCDPR